MRGQAGSLSLIIAALLTFALKVQGQASLSDSTFAIEPGTVGLVSAILVQADGKILVGGSFTQIAGQTHPYLARLESNGQLDTSFPAETDGSVFRLLAQPDGKILVGGSFNNLQGVARKGIGRLLTNGTVDLDFDAGLLPGSEQSAFALGLQPAGKILYVNLAPNGELFRLNSDGQLDSSFVQTNVFQGFHAFAICPRTNGSILVGGGFGAVNGFATPGLALLDTDGRLDTNYNSQLKTNSTTTAILEQPDGSLLIGGGMWRQGSTNRISLARLTSILEWDSSFHADSIDPNLSAYGYGYIFSMLLLPDDKILVGGNFQEVGGYWRRSIVRLDSAGRVDPCFDSALGLASSYSLASNYSFGVIALARQSDGKILAGGDFVDLISDKPNTTNIVRLLSESDCNNNRVYLRPLVDGNFTATATFSPGGTNSLQISTNLVDWVDSVSNTRPYLYLDMPSPAASGSQIYFRGKKQY